MNRVLPLDSPAVRHPRLPLPFTGWLHLFLQPTLLWAWWSTTVARLEQAPVALMAGSPTSIATTAVASRYLGLVIEAGFYALFWRAFGARLPFGRLLIWIATLSSLDLFADVIRVAAADLDGWPRMLVAALAGVSLLGPDPATNGLALSFGGFGLMMLARVGGTAFVQARALQRSVTGPLVLTSVLWLASRVSSWWLFDLARGVSSGR